VRANSKGPLYRFRPCGFVLEPPQYTACKNISGLLELMKMPISLQDSKNFKLQE
jgi:hypothetical protein